MRGKIVWVVLSCLMAVTLVLASCGPAEEEEEKEGATVVGEVEEKEAAEEKVKEEVEEETEMVRDAMGKLVEKPQYGGTLIHPFQRDLKSPQLMQIGTTISYVSSFVYEGMELGDWSRGPAGTNEWSWVHYSYVPYTILALAESFEQPDPLTYIYHMKKGIHFQNKPPVNGREVTAEDFVYSWYHYLDAMPSGAGSARDYIESVKALDKYTVEIKANQIHCQIRESVRSLRIHAREIIEQYGDESADVAAVCGTGPFIMTDFVASSSILFEKNPTYWGYDELHPENKLPYVDAVKLLLIPDFTTQMAAMRSGKVDFLREVPPMDADAMRQTNPELLYVKELNYICSPKVNFRADLEPFSDIKVRKAMNMAIDREAIVRDYLGGEGIIFSYPFMATWAEVFTPFEELSEDITENYDYNPTKAKQLLAEAGYPDGFDAECIFESRFSERMEILQQYWAAIDVNVDLKIVERATWTSMTYGKTYPSMSAGQAGSTTPYSTMLYKYTGAYYNYEMYSDPYFDETFDTIIATLDEVEQNKLLKDVNVYYLKSAPHIAFPADYIYFFWQPWVKNYHGENCLGNLDYGHVDAHAWLDLELRKEMAGR